MLEYRYISIERIITSSLFGNIYGVLFAIRQYEGKSYRVFVELLVEAYTSEFFSIYHTYTTHILLLYCRNSQKDSVEYYLKNSFFLISPLLISTSIRWNRFIFWTQRNLYFTILYSESKPEKKIYQTIVRS